MRSRPRALTMSKSPLRSRPRATKCLGSFTSTTCSSGEASAWHDTLVNGVNHHPFLRRFRTWVSFHQGLRRRLVLKWFLYDTLVLHLGLKHGISGPKIPWQSMIPKLFQGFSLGGCSEFQNFLIHWPPSNSQKKTSRKHIEKINTNKHRNSKQTKFKVPNQTTRSKFNDFILFHHHPNMWSWFQWESSSPLKMVGSGWNCTWAQSKASKERRKKNEPEKCCATSSEKCK